MTGWRLMLVILIYWGVMWGAAWLFFRRDFRYHPVISVLISLCAYTLLMFIYMWGYNGEHRFLFSTLSMAVCIAALKIMWKGSVSMTAFYVLMVKNYQDCISLFLIAIGSKWDVSGWIRLQPADGQCAAYLLGTLVWTPLLYLLIVKLFKPLMNENIGAVFWKYLWLIPAFYYCIYRLGIYEQYAVYNQEAKVPLLLALIWFAGIFFSYVVLLKMLMEISRKEKLHKQLIRSEIQIESQYRRMEEMKLLLLDGYAREGETEKLRDSIRNYLQESYSGKPLYICANMALNLMLQYYSELAEKEQIELKYTVRVPEQIPFAEQDLAVLAGNLLENAVEGCRSLSNPQERKIYCRIQLLNYCMLAVIVRNTFDGALKVNNGEFISSKGPYRGIGLTSVKKLTEKYDGVMNCEYTKQEFKVSVLMKGKDFNREK